MSSVHATVRAHRTGLGTVLAVSARIQRRTVLVWVGALSAAMIGTAASVAALYDTQAKIDSYASAVTTGNALRAINGTVAGIDTLGGVVQDEFGFLAAFLLPLLGIALVARSTRREEESGRLELVLAGRIARREPTLAALLLAAAAAVAIVLVFGGGLIACGVPVSGSVLYALSLGTLAMVFAAVAALLAQLTIHARGVYAGATIVLVISYLLRGVGDVTGSWVTWLSPLGWAERTAPFGDQQWWVLAVPLTVSSGLALAGVSLAGRRDVGSALFRGGAGPARASRWRRTVPGLAAYVHRPAILGWLAGGVLLTAMMGALSRQLLDAMAANPALAQAMGLSPGTSPEGLVAVTQVFLAVIATGYAVQAVASLRAEEAEGRLETGLAGTLSRTRWLGAHVVVALAGLLVVVLGSAVVLAITTALSIGNRTQTGPILVSALAYLPAELVLAGLALAIYGVRPRLIAVAWAGYAGTVFVALVGSGLRLPSWVLDLAPTTHVGYPPLVAAGVVPLAVMSVVSVGLAVVGFTAFGRRGIPQL